MELKDLITGAQEAMDQGDFRLAIAAGEHALVGYDACLSAHRMLGEAYLERGDQQTAIGHFERTLAIDPLNVVARLGLGVASEETRRYEDAYGHYLCAWETNPALDQVRDELVRLRGVLNVEGRLHPTRAGLAGIHARCGQFGRAAGEWRAVLSLEPDSSRARTALAELLWRQGDDAGASAAAREALRGCPENARALLILADVEKRRNGPTAADLIQRYSQVDPAGEIVETMRHWRSDVDLDDLLAGAALIDTFDFESNRSRQTSGLSRKGITSGLATSQMAAPDLWDTLVQDLANGVPSKPAPTLATGVEPFSWADGAPPAELASPAAEPPAQPVVATKPADSDIFPELASMDAFVVPDVEETAAPEVDQPVEPEDDLLSIFSRTDAAIPDVSIPSADAAAPSDDFDFDLVPFSLDELTGVVAPSHEVDDAALAATFGVAADPLPEPPAAPVAPVPPVIPEEPVVAAAAPEPYVDPFVSADGRIDLTAGWDTLDRVLEAATPGASGEGGFDALIAELGVDGVVPFDGAVESADEDAWSPFSDVDFDVPVAGAPVRNEPFDIVIDPSVPDATGETLDLSDVEALDINTFVAPEPEPVAEQRQEPALGSDILAGIPLPEPSGYTQLLRNVDEETLPDHAGDDEIDPFANPDATGEPLAFDELIGVTSSDGTGPLAPIAAEPAEVDLAAELDFSRTDLSSAVPQVDAEPFDFGIDGVEPFDTGGFDLAATIESESAYGQVRPFSEPEPEPAVSDLPLAAELADIVPFAFDDGSLNGVDGSPVDFSELDVAPEPMLFAPPAVAEPEPILFEEAEPAQFEYEAPAAELEVESPPADTWFDGEEPVEVAAELDEASVDDEPEDLLVAEVDMAEPIEPILAPVGIRSVSWPQFVGQTSELIDRPVEGGSLFARIAAQKEALVEMGVVATGRRLIPIPQVTEPAVAVLEPVIAIAEPVVKPPEPPVAAAAEAEEQIRIDLMGMRVRLIEDESSAREIADTLEEAIAGGLQSPLALRVLGEAYLKLGMVERAAAQFRQAMLTRRRGG
ncbi:MAG TPA: tetratricopeptide repeat protein [Thermomicrobiales bacterium]|nr:tetratricopeptide repeat protein [Thermomicrobiales bacterium]